jgi:hypothetical protein
MRTPPHTSDSWLSSAIERIEADFQRSADTHLMPLALPKFSACGIDFYLKDESTHPTGSLKHRLARSLFLYALCNGWIGEGSILSLLCDSGERYLPTYHDVQWVERTIGDCTGAQQRLGALLL